MKRAFLIIAVLLSACSIFAYKNSLSFSFVPAGAQIITSSIEEENDVNSRYGIGAEISYQRYFVKGLYVEGGIDWNTFLMKDGRKAYTNLMAFAGVGYKVQFSKVFSTFFHLDFTEDTLLYNKKASEAFGLKTGIGIGFDLGSFTLKASCDGSFGFNKDSQAEYVVYRVLPLVGFSINL